MQTRILNMDDLYATNWPIQAENGQQLGEIVEEGPFYRARRTTGSARVTHQGPARHLHGDAAEDFFRWLDAPLDNLHIWTEVDR